MATVHHNLVLSYHQTFAEPQVVMLFSNIKGFGFDIPVNLLHRIMQVYYHCTHINNCRTECFGGATAGFELNLLELLSRGQEG